jgi:DNA-binding protein YbaB
MTPDFDGPPEVQELWSRYQDLRQRLPELMSQLATVQGEGRSADNLVTVRCGMQGNVLSVEVSSRGYAGKDSIRLAEDIMSAAMNAQGDAARKVAHITSNDTSGILTSTLKGEFQIPEITTEKLARLQNQARH